MGKFSVGKFEFKSKVELKKFVKKYFKDMRLPACIRESNLDFEFIYGLVKRHPDFSSKFIDGIAAVTVERHPIQKDSFQTHVINRLGLKQDFSWVKCVTGLKTTAKANLLSAMRLSITDDVMAFKANSDGRCANCGARDGLQVDHINPFAGIANEFLRDKQDLPTEFADHPWINKAIFRPEDIEFELKWTDFHRKIAKFQMLCRPCNLKKSST
jgi:hypothetical protein